MTDQPNLPSEDLTWADLDDAQLVLVVAPDATIRLYLDGTASNAQHAAMLRGTAYRLDPDGERVEAVAQGCWASAMVPADDPLGDVQAAWETISHAARDHWRAIARAALEAGA